MSKFSVLQIGQLKSKSEGILNNKIVSRVIKNSFIASFKRFAEVVYTDLKKFYRFITES